LVDAGACHGAVLDLLGNTRPAQHPQPDAADGCDIGAIELPADVVFGAGFE
jgi:hypothetical protein